jgi:hypothetical protein
MEDWPEFRGLMLTAQETLSANEASEIREFIEAREYVLALEALCGMLVDADKRVTPDLYYRIHSLAQQLGVDPFVIEKVKAIVATD